MSQKKEPITTTLKDWTLIILSLIAIFVSLNANYISQTYNDIAQRTFDYTFHRVNSELSVTFLGFDKCDEFWTTIEDDFLESAIFHDNSYENLEASVALAYRKVGNVDILFNNIGDEELFITSIRAQLERGNYPLGYTWYHYSPICRYISDDPHTVPPGSSLLLSTEIRRMPLRTTEFHFPTFEWTTNWASTSYSPYEMMRHLWFLEEAEILCYLKSSLHLKYLEEHRERGIDLDNIDYDNYFAYLEDSVYMKFIERNVHDFLYRDMIDPEFLQYLKRQSLYNNPLSNRQIVKYLLDSENLNNTEYVYLLTEPWTYMNYLNYIESPAPYLDNSFSIKWYYTIMSPTYGVRTLELVSGKYCYSNGTFSDVWFDTNKKHKILTIQ